MSLLCCRYYAESDPQDGHRLISLAADQVFGGAEVAFPAYWNGPEVMNSLEESKSCKIIVETLFYGTPFDRHLTLQAVAVNTEIKLLKTKGVGLQTQRKCKNRIHLHCTDLEANVKAGKKFSYHCYRFPLAGENGDLKVQTNGFLRTCEP